MKTKLPNIDSNTGKFIDGDYSSGEVGTRVTAKWLNDVQDRLQDLNDESKNVLALGGLVFDENNKKQLAEAIKAYIASIKASLTNAGLVQLNSATDSDSESQAATPKAVKGLKALIDALTKNLGNYIPNSKKSNATNSNSADTVATSAAVKSAYDLAANATPKHNTITNLNTLTGSQFFGGMDAVTGFPRGYQAGFDWNGFQGDAGYQKFQFLCINEQDIKFRINDDGANWSNWTSFLTNRGGEINGTVNFKTGDYSYFNQWNLSNCCSRSEVCPDSNGNFYKISYRNASNQEQHSVHFPKRGVGKYVAYEDWVRDRFSPLSHNHAWKTVTNIPATATRWPTWAEVTGKPTTSRKDYSKTITTPRAVNAQLATDPVTVIGSVHTFPDGRIMQIVQIKDCPLNRFALEDVGTTGKTGNNRNSWWSAGERGVTIPVTLWTAFPNKVLYALPQIVRSTGASSQSFSAEAEEWQCGWNIRKQGSNKTGVYIDASRFGGQTDEPVDIIIVVEGY